MSATFELKTTISQAFTFELLSSRGHSLLLGGDYPTKAEAEQGIKDVQLGSLMGHQIAAGRTPAGETFFVIKDTQGQIIAKSALFGDQMLFDNALHAVKDNACIAAIADLTTA
ncbi:MULTISPECIES: hypothetical protein [unclassified Oceanobacter]|jgi:uncharacterized protein YegP (UPF0339 family)|uniref:hypothetical protein n=1 Tax=unclassified Oceanobacter TaxID=2620260 RepID=UPI0027325A27|nr:MULTISPECIES: hypothetical protein [unclassified Oceanobacter]MDP2505527.1 hypothetical protein [Oceanobacter sp. 3_MG-2023]MDP2547102.1 hypothetical protein [Oceanobacter sp. 4_MG-2023]MDP2609727.1 hypothetical protein [Oceanobacter sp. 1_MG-2023]MDP2613058.1 hypothetical protein [Oceanobacter sp. 2_MG-2023]